VRALGLGLGEGHDPGDALGDRNVQAGGRGAHHGPAEQHAVEILADAHALQHEAQRRADRDAIVALLPDRRSGDGDHALLDAAAAGQQAADLGRRGDVHAERADVDGQPSRRHLAPEQRREQHLLGTLRVLHAELLDGDRQTRGDALAEVLHRVGLVGLDADDDALGLSQLEQVADSGVDVLALLEHDPVVGGQEGLALDAVDDHRVDLLVLRDLQLHMGRERRPAEPDDAGVLNRGDDLVDARRAQRAGLAVHHLLRRPGVGLEIDAGHHATGDAGRQRDPAHDPRRRGVHRHRDESVGAGDALAAGHLLPLPDHGHRRLADVLDQRDHQERREGKLPDRRSARLVLRFRRVNPVPEGLEPQEPHRDVS
jgi:hypothetical protein